MISGITVSVPPPCPKVITGRPAAMASTIVIPEIFYLRTDETDCATIKRGFFPRRRRVLETLFFHLPANGVFLAPDLFQNLERKVEFCERLNNQIESFISDQTSSAEPIRSGFCRDRDCRDVYRRINHCRVPSIIPFDPARGSCESLSAECPACQPRVCPIGVVYAVAAAIERV